mmetsp:Transcript_1106/g.2364  ORF Transcript_1106/g.2364 Transcript_1106/m.2364 type:complete len:101 (-) Transcript_1106:44-346(-)
MTSSSKVKVRSPANSVVPRFERRLALMKDGAVLRYRSETKTKTIARCRVNTIRQASLLSSVYKRETHTTTTTTIAAATTTTTITTMWGIFELTSGVPQSR